MKKNEIRNIVINRKAKFDYEILETVEAGIVLEGSEVKSIKEGRVSIQDAYVESKGGELFIVNMHVSPYSKSSHFSHSPDRDRKLLLHKHEIKRFIGKIKERGLTLIPLRVYEKRGLIKLELALVKGKKKYEKREEIKKRLIEREIRRALKKEEI